MPETKPCLQNSVEGAWIDGGAVRIDVFDPETGGMLAGLRRILAATANPISAVNKGARYCGTTCRQRNFAVR